jgi:uncharacterized protein YkwD
MTVNWGEWVTDLEKDAWRAQNQLRRDPTSFIPYLEYMLEYMDDEGILRLPESDWGLRTQEGRAAVEEAIAFLRVQAPVQELTWNDGLWQVAKFHVDSQGPTGQTGHDSPNGESMTDRFRMYGLPGGTWSENIAYYIYDANDGFEMINQLLVDDGVPDRGHRTNLFEPALATTGIDCGMHEVYTHMCVMNYAQTFEAFEAPTNNDWNLLLAQVGQEDTWEDSYPWTENPSVITDIFSSRFSNMTNGTLSHEQFEQMAYHVSVFDDLDSWNIYYEYNYLVDMEEGLSFDEQTSMWDDVIHGRGVFGEGDPAFTWTFDASVGMNDFISMYEAAFGEAPRQVKSKPSTFNWAQAWFLRSFVSYK